MKNNFIPKQTLLIKNNFTVLNLNDNNNKKHKDNQNSKSVFFQDLNPLKNKFVTRKLNENNIK